MTTTAVTATAQATSTGSASSTIGEDRNSAAKALPPKQRLLPARRCLDREEKAIVKKVRAYMETRSANHQQVLVRAMSFRSSCCRPSKEIADRWLGFEAMAAPAETRSCSGLSRWSWHASSFILYVLWGAQRPGMGSIYLDGSEEQKRMAARWRAGKSRLLRPHRASVGSERAEE